MPATIEDVLGRIEDKKRDYQSYDFTRAENDAFKTFFDLAQEFEDTRDFYNLCVAVPKAFFGLDARLYLIDPGENRFLLARCPVKTLKVAGVPNPGEELTTYLNRRDSLFSTISGAPKARGLIVSYGQPAIIRGGPCALPLSKSCQIDFKTGYRKPFVLAGIILRRRGHARMAASGSSRESIPHCGFPTSTLLGCKVLFRPLSLP